MIWIDRNRRKCSKSRMRKSRTIFVALALLLTTTTVTFAANALMGTWKLDESKSKFASGAAKNTMVTYTPATVHFIMSRPTLPDQRQPILRLTDL
jgi:cytochrome oxidase assembly protein ShyY1